MRDKPNLTAFPNEGFNGWGEPQQGITMRDYFAAHAGEDDINSWQAICGYVEKEVTGMDGRKYITQVLNDCTREEARYLYADAMMKARGQ